MNASPRSDEAGQRAWAQLPVGERRVVDQVFVHVGKALEAYQRQAQARRDTGRSLRRSVERR